MNDMIYKKLSIIFVSFFCAASFVSAQSIVGKWKCTKEFLVGIGLLYNEMHGTYEFKKNGKFTLRIRGDKQMRGLFAFDYYNGRDFSASKLSRRDRLLTLKVKGKYVVENNRVTTSVRPKDVKCFIDTGYEQKEITGREGVNEQKLIEGANRDYSSAAVVADFQINTIKHEKRGLWTWRKARMRMDGDTLVIGNFIKMVRE